MTKPYLWMNEAMEALPRIRRLLQKGVEGYPLSQILGLTRGYGEGLSPRNHRAELEC